MDSIPYGDNINYEWFVVQYDEHPVRFTRRIVHTKQCTWNEHMKRIEASDKKYKEHVLIYEYEACHVAYIKYRAKTHQECVDRYNLMQIVTYELFRSPLQIAHMMQRLHEKDHWILITYARSPWANDQTALAYLHQDELTLCIEDNELVTYINEGERTYRATVIKILDNCEGMRVMFESIKHELMDDFEMTTDKDTKILDKEIEEHFGVENYKHFWDVKTCLQYNRMLKQREFQVSKRYVRLMTQLWMNNQQKFSSCPPFSTKCQILRDDQTHLS